MACAKERIMFRYPPKNTSSLVNKTPNVITTMIPHSVTNQSDLSDDQKTSLPIYTNLSEIKKLAKEMTSMDKCAPCLSVIHDNVAHNHILLSYHILKIEILYNVFVTMFSVIIDHKNLICFKNLTSWSSWLS